MKTTEIMKKLDTMMTTTPKSVYYSEDYKRGIAEAASAVEMIMDAVIAGRIDTAQNLLEDLRRIEQQMEGIMTALDEMEDVLEAVEDMS